MRRSTVARRRRVDLDSALGSYRPRGLVDGLPARSGRRFDLVLPRDLVSALLEVRHAQLRLADEERDLVGRLVAAGFTWAEIGDIYGITRQSAQSRFGAKVAP